LIQQRKLKVFNDPVYGSIGIPNDFILELIAHPFFQRLRRISQMGLSYLSYPGAHHTRFHHAIGAMHLMNKAITTLRYKGVEIDKSEEHALLAAILLHDIGHGPFSHALEEVLVKDVHHETLSLKFMQALNESFKGELKMAISIFEGRHPKKFLSALVSSQLDIDRLDYLKRDSFFSGVAEGNINSERLITTMNVQNDNIVIEEKGIHSIEKFLMARRFMYWQVYLHKTSVVAELMLKNVINRARHLIKSRSDFMHETAVGEFLQDHIHLNKSDFLVKFAQLDDTDIIQLLKTWIDDSDSILAFLSKGLIHRNLLDIRFYDKAPSDEEYLNISKKVADSFKINLLDAEFLVCQGVLTNTPYEQNKQPISILKRNGEVVEFLNLSQFSANSGFTAEQQRHYICFPKSVF